MQQHSKIRKRKTNVRKANKESFTITFNNFLTRRETLMVANSNHLSSYSAFTVKTLSHLFILAPLQSCEGGTVGIINSLSGDNTSEENEAERC